MFTDEISKLANYMQSCEINAFCKECKKHTISKSDFIIV